MRRNPEIAIKDNHMKMTDYREAMIAGFWNYQASHFPEWGNYFERARGTDWRPPVFHKESADHNVLVKPGISDERKIVLLNEIPRRDRHRWFRSMSSSQALAQSVFGNLKLYDKLNLLRDLKDESGEPIFAEIELDPTSFTLEYHVDYLGEPRQTSIDVFINGNYRIAIECKLTEQEVGRCSRPRLTMRDSNYDQDHCNGTYSVQRGRRSRCSLTNIGVHYWKHIPKIFSWHDNEDLAPCPVYENYQLVRNILAACVRDDMTSTSYGHAVLIYDERNPSFSEGGNGGKAYEQTREALLDRKLLRKCSWQQIVKNIRSCSDFHWLTKGLEEKYGM